MPDELFDVVNEDNNVIGQELRSIVHQRGLWHRGTNVFLFTPDGKLLVQQRSKNKDTFPSALDCSVSEHVQAGEDYFHAAVRGLKEELGIEGIELRLLIEFSMIYGRNDNEISQMFEGIVDPSAVHFDPNEIERISCHTLDELSAMLSVGQVVFSRWFEQLLLWYLGKPSDVHVRRIYGSKSEDGMIANLENAIEGFQTLIEDLPEELFLKLIDDWTPRDVVAHLAWWNRHMIAASQSLQAGNVPSYYADAANDYRTINAQAIAEFPSRDRRALLKQMQTTLKEFKDYLRALKPGDWDADHGVTHYRGGAATIRRIVESLAGDYASHTQQIEKWRKSLHTF